MKCDTLLSEILNSKRSGQDVLAHLIEDEHLPDEACVGAREGRGQGVLGIRTGLGVEVEEREEGFGLSVEERVGG